MTEVPKDLSLVHAFQGFVDAGQSVKLALDHLDTNYPHERVAEITIDDLYDYRARRPILTFKRDHFADIALPTLVVDLYWDAASTPFLLMHGPEPDMAWQQVTQSIIELADHLAVRQTVGLQAIPWPAPHTRPLLVTPHASDPSMLGEHRSPVDIVEVPGSLTSVVEFATGRSGLPAQGFAVHIPHYLVNAEYPDGAITVLRELHRAAGLSFDVGQLQHRSDEVRREIDEQIVVSEENREIVAALEQQHDAEVRDWPEQLPSADEIADQVEQFLADQDRDR